MKTKIFTMVFNLPEDLSKEEIDLYSSKITNYARDIIPNIEVESSLITDNNRSVISLSKETSIEETSDASYQVASAITGHMHDDKFFKIKTYMLDEGDTPAFSDIEITPNKNDIYVDIFTNVMYIWDGTNYIAIASPSAQTTRSDTEENNDIEIISEDERDRLEQKAYLNMKYDPECFVIRSLIAMCKSIEAEILEGSTGVLFSDKQDYYIFAGNNIPEYRDKFDSGYTIFAKGDNTYNRNYKITIKRIINDKDKTKINYSLVIDYIIGDPTKKFLKLRGLLLKSFHVFFHCQEWRDNKREVLREYRTESSLDELRHEIDNKHISNFLFSISQYESRTFWSDIFHVSNYQYYQY